MSKGSPFGFQNFDGILLEFQKTQQIFFRKRASLLSLAHLSRVFHLLDKAIYSDTLTDLVWYRWTLQDDIYLHLLRARGCHDADNITKHIAYQDKTLSWMCQRRPDCSWTRPCERGRTPRLCTGIKSLSLIDQCCFKYRKLFLWSILWNVVSTVESFQGNLDITELA